MIVWLKKGFRLGLGLLEIIKVSVYIMVSIISRAMTRIYVFWLILRFRVMIRVVIMVKFYIMVIIRAKIYIKGRVTIRILIIGF